MTTDAYPIGTPGVPWGDAEKAQWLARQQRQRSYTDEVVSKIDRLRETFDVTRYGELNYADDHYPLFVMKSPDWDDSLPIVLVTGGVHGYETSGVQGALQFAGHQAADYFDHVNLVIAPCVSPWGYERIHRWNPMTLDPNRNFHAETPVPEAAQLMAMVAPIQRDVLMHIDLHETTDTDESEFRPALAARNGERFVPGEVPDGFYLCGDSEKPQAAFQQAVIEGVSRITHIAPSDANGDLIGSPSVAPGVIEYPLSEWGLCAGMTDAAYRTTTEVYPDSPRATPEQCNAAQAAAACAGVDFVLANAVAPQV